MPTRTPLPADAALTAAPELLGLAGLDLPNDASDVTVDLVVHAELQAASVTTFVSSQAGAEAMCVAAGGWPLEDGSLIDYEREMLGDTIPLTGALVCAPDASGRNAKVVITPGSPAQVAVLVYRVPTR